MGAPRRRRSGALSGVGDDRQTGGEAIVSEHLHHGQVTGCAAPVVAIGALALSFRSARLPVVAAAERAVPPLLLRLCAQVGEALAGGVEVGGVGGHDAATSRALRS